MLMRLLILTFGQRKSYWIGGKRQSDKSIHLAQIYQKGPGCLRDAKSARKAAKILEEHGQIEPLEPGIFIDGAQRKEAWRLVP